MKKTTIKDVAARADVAPSTVSRVINEVSNVREKTRERVLSAILDLDYEPDEHARALGSKKESRDQKGDGPGPSSSQPGAGR